MLHPSTPCRRRPAVLSMDLASSIQNRSVALKTYSLEPKSHLPKTPNTSSPAPKSRACLPTSSLAPKSLAHLPKTPKTSSPEPKSRACSPKSAPRTTLLTNPRRLRSLPPWWTLLVRSHPGSPTCECPGPADPGWSRRWFRPTGSEGPPGLRTSCPAGERPRRAAPDSPRWRRSRRVGSPRPGPGSAELSLSVLPVPSLPGQRWSGRPEAESEQPPERSGQARA